MSLKYYIHSFLAFCLCVTFSAELISLEESFASDGEERGHGAAVPIGSVGLVLGRVFVESGDSQIERARTGHLLSETDIIRTESNGHAHIRFVDDALVSVRPNSVLEITQYKYNSERPQDSVVKFNLLQGTARAVSGKAAEAAKDRFRLNTPIAAIGVRGTDFVVSVSPTSVRAMVNQGAIVFTPFSDQCSAQGIGPCNTNAVELDSNDAQILEFNTSLAAPRIIQLSAAREAQSELGSLQVRRNSNSGEAFGDTNSRDGFDGSSGEEIVAPESSSEVLTKSMVSITDVISEGVTSVDLRVNAKEQAPYKTGFTPATKVGTEAAKKRLLVWGRYSEGEANLERITLPFHEAGDGRNITISGDFEYFLFRDEQEKERVLSELGRVGFSLNSAQAYYKNRDDVSVVAVTGGDLIVDFQQNKFSTELNMHHLDLGEAVFRAGGVLRDGGYFSSYASGGKSSLAGAVSLDGQEAGYFFDFLNWQGAIQGITLWNAGN